MRVQILAPHWGSNHLAADEFIARVQAAGFDGIEMSLPRDPAEREHWVARIAEAGLLLAAQQWETVFHADFDAHREALETYLRNACAARPLFVNSHTGKDFYTHAQNRALIDLATRIGHEQDVPVYHEIHRSRFSGHPMLLLPYLREMPALELTADLSHWCCACESLLDDQAGTLAQVLPHARHIHARVGHAQGPQVNDFRAPEHAAELARHLQWWDGIVALRRQAGAARLTITPEFGPVPYTQALPYSGAPVTDAWELNVAMAQLLRARYAG
jgi:sugar phosphate isomerase/epimerase